MLSNMSNAPKRKAEESQPPPAPQPKPVSRDAEKKPEAKAEPDRKGEGAPLSEEGLRHAAQVALQRRIALARTEIAAVLKMRGVALSARLFWHQDGRAGAEPVLVDAKDS
jgi:hypothetical protein